ncbi:MAG: hypothetical protein LDL24_11835 [Treponema sp.]|nr:hypothetical protein [Treponema sp.]
MKQSPFINLILFLFLLMSPLWAQEGASGSAAGGPTEAPAGALAAESPPVLRGVYFTETGCGHCDAFLYVQKQKMEAASGVRLELETYDILSAEGYQRCVDMLAQRGLAFTVFPVLFVGHNVYRGSTEIEQNVPLELAAFKETGTFRPAVIPASPEASGRSAASQAGGAALLKAANPAGAAALSAGNTLGTLATILAAGLLDGINPCAFSTLLFFLSFIALRRTDRRSLFLVGLSFIGSVFLAYMLIGFGFLQVLRSILSAGRATYVVKVIVSALATLLVILNIRDAMLARQGRAGDSALQLPAPLKRLSHRVIRSFSALPLYVLGAAASGFLVSLIELACTGQVYLPTLVYLNQSALSHWSVFLLLLYNLGFILPLVLVFVLYLFGLRHEKLRAWYGSRIALVRTLTALLFLIMGIVVWV